MRDATDRLIQAAIRHAQTLAPMRVQAIRAGDAQLQQKIDEVLLQLGVTEEDLETQARQVRLAMVRESEQSA